MFKFFITASQKIRAKRRYLEYKKIKKKISFNEVLKNLKNRDKSDRFRKFGALKKSKSLDKFFKETKKSKIFILIIYNFLEE